MKGAVFTLFILVSFLGHAKEIRYIGDEVRIPLRDAPQSTASIVNFAFVGNEVEWLQSNQNGWSKVRYLGAQSWVLSQYLSKEDPYKTNKNTQQLINNVEQKNLKEALEESEYALLNAQDTNQALQIENNKLKIEANIMQNAYQNSLRLKEENTALNSQLTLEVKNTNLLRQRLQLNEQSVQHGWLVLGAIIGMFGLLFGVLLTWLFVRKIR